jgi:hypothetical protein
MRVWTEAPPPANPPAPFRPDNNTSTMLTAEHAAGKWPARQHPPASRHDDGHIPRCLNSRCHTAVSSHDSRLSLRSTRRPAGRCGQARTGCRRTRYRRVFPKDLRGQRIGDLPMRWSSAQRNRCPVRGARRAPCRPVRDADGAATGRRSLKAGVDRLRRRRQRLWVIFRVWWAMFRRRFLATLQKGRTG